ncbi:MAG: hypothetical protein Q7S32_00440 [bacterium]|nr:hypothetical protein [bacterium]
MNLKDVKKLVKTLGHVVVVEEDGSGLVIISLDKYLSLVNGHEEAVTTAEVYTEESGEVVLPESIRGLNEQELMLIEKLNQDIAILKEEIKKKELEELESGLGEG